jgi:hypothetical protein
MKGYDKSRNITKYLFKKNIPYYKNLNDIPDKYFDVITCFDVIEHTTNPKELIEMLHKKTKKNGLLILSTPNSQSLSSKILGQKWWVFGPTAHFVLFSVFSLNLLLAKANFKVVSFMTDTLTPWFTPTEKFISKVFNKFVYLFLFPFQKIIFKNHLGDNILIVARNITLNNDSKV